MTKDELHEEESFVFQVYSDLEYKKMVAEQDDTIGAWKSYAKFSEIFITTALRYMDMRANFWKEKCNVEDIE